MAHESIDRNCPKHESEKDTEWNGHSYARSYPWHYRYCHRCNIVYKAEYIKGSKEK